MAARANPSSHDSYVPRACSVIPLALSVRLVALRRVRFSFVVEPRSGPNCAAFKRQSRDPSHQCSHCKSELFMEHHFSSPTFEVERSNQCLRRSGQSSAEDEVNTNRHRPFQRSSRHPRAKHHGHPSHTLRGKCSTRSHRVRALNLDSRFRFGPKRERNTRTNIS